MFHLDYWESCSFKKQIWWYEPKSQDQENDQEPIVALKMVTKIYPRNFMKNIPTIRNLCMDFKKGEIFAVMGTDGSGKSTFNETYIALYRYLLYASTTGTKDSITYCDEEDIIWPHLTVEEHLYLFAILSGISKESANSITEELLKELGLESNAKSNADHLSGGSKRKLCVILSLLGNSRLVLLDEPTTGVDPLSKDILWRRLHLEFPPSKDRTLVLTTHSASEAEDHCSRIGLLVNGSLKCSGTSQELKDKFSKRLPINSQIKI
ncbi:ATP-binding cassette sub-family A member 8-A [Caerostris extrusa]|uniref:ATP-binding cassette sub-family A member 8-A n=1 Tax=Caerostris extrusa TaxID=172846 RepID=A0AAV4XCH1_CAEEX|nr:ATP-binding cassette sub-family A member 8-A [Caerostris extrusa]